MGRSTRWPFPESSSGGRSAVSEPSGFSESVDNRESFQIRESIFAAVVQYAPGENLSVQSGSHGLHREGGSGSKKPITFCGIENHSGSLSSPRPAYPKVGNYPGLRSPYFTVSSPFSQPPGSFAGITQVMKYQHFMTWHPGPWEVPAGSRERLHFFAWGDGSRNSCGLQNRNREGLAGVP